MTMTEPLGYEAERELIEDQIAQLQFRLFQLDRKVPDTEVPMAPRTRNYCMVCEWSLKNQEPELIISGRCVSPDKREVSLNYMVSHALLFDLRDRIALFEHLHRKVVWQIVGLLASDRAGDKP